MEEIKIEDPPFLVSQPSIDVKSVIDESIPVEKERKEDYNVYGLVKAF